MNNKKFRFIVIIFIIAIIIVLSYVLMKIERNSNVISSETDNYKEFDKIVKADNLKNCAVNGEEITNRDIILTEVLNEEENSTAKDKTIEKKIILQNIKSDNIVLSEKEDNYIKNIIEGLKNNPEINSRYTEEEKNELIGCVSEKLYDDALIEQHKAEFIKQLANKTFSSDDEEVLEKYNECINIQEKWDNKEGVSYSELIESREAVYNAYVQKLISKSEIE